MICVGFNSPITMFRISGIDREQMSVFFRDLIKFLYLNAISEHKLISDRLYRKYVRKEDARSTYHLIKSLEDKFIEENKDKSSLYFRYIMAFYNACEETLNIGNFGIEIENRLQIGLDIPYGIDEKRLPNEFYDELPKIAEPFWFRKISMKEYVLKYSNNINILDMVRWCY